MSIEGMNKALMDEVRGLTQLVEILTAKEEQLRARLAASEVREAELRDLVQQQSTLLEQQEETMRRLAEQRDLFQKAGQEAIRIATALLM